MILGKYVVGTFILFGFYLPKRYTQRDRLKYRFYIFHEMNLPEIQGLFILAVSVD